METLIKIMSILNKPFHYFFVGCVFIFWEIFVSKSTQHINIFIGIVLISIAVASFVEWLCHKFHSYYEKYRKQTKVKQDYSDLQGVEKEIINYCIKNNTCIYRKNYLMTSEEEVSAIYSLIVKGFGVNITYGGDFALSSDILDILKKYVGNSVK